MLLKIQGSYDIIYVTQHTVNDTKRIGENAVNKDYQYDAFISYRHLNPDKDVAQKLQKMLEAYRPPRSAVSEEFTGLHLFRDETELRTSPDLDGDIKYALENSRYLIAICSETTKESYWCPQEINYFKALHQGSTANIITVVAQGNPTEVIPDSLCHETVKLTDEEGTVYYQERTIEPLAANLVASTARDRRKRLKSEFLRIAAPLLGCKYDDLYNRDLRRRTKRTVIGASALMLFLLGFALYNGAMLFKISSQKVDLEQANDSLQKTNEALEKKTDEANQNAAEAQAQRVLAETESVRNIALLSRTLWENGDTRAAIETILPAFSAIQEGIVAPIAERVLANELNAFAQTAFRQTKKLEHDSAVMDMFYVAGGKTLITETSNAYYFWNTESGEAFHVIEKNQCKLIAKPLTYERSQIIKDTVGTFYMDKTGLFGYKKDKVDEAPYIAEALFLISSGKIEEISAYTGETLSYITSPQGDYLRVDSAILCGDEILCQVQNYQNNKIYYACCNINDLEDLTTYTVADTNLFENVGYGMIVALTDTSAVVRLGNILNSHFYHFTIKDGTLTQPQELFANDVNSDFLSTVGNGVLYTLTYTEFLTTLLYDDVVLSAFDLDTGALLWSETYQDVSKFRYQSMGVLYADDTNGALDLLYVVLDRELHLYDMATGACVRSYELNTEAVSSYHAADGTIFVIDADGHEIAFPLKRQTAESLANPSGKGQYVINEIAPDLSVCLYGNGQYSVRQENSFDVMLYENTVNEDYTILYQNVLLESNQCVTFSPDGSYALVLTSTDDTNVNYLFLMEFTGKHVTQREFLQINEWGTSCGFLPNGNIYVLYGDALKIYDRDSGEVLFTYFDGNAYPKCVVHAATNTVAFSSEEQLLVFSPETEYETIYSDTVTEAFILDSTRVLAVTYSNMIVTDYITDHSLILKNDPSLPKISWAEDKIGCYAVGDTMVLLYENGTVSSFDLSTGEEIDRHTFKIPAVIAIEKLDENNVVLLTAKGVLYQINAVTEEIQSTLDLEISTPLPSMVLTYYEEEHQLIVSKKNGGDACIVDMETFSVRFDVPAFQAYDPVNSHIAVNSHHTAGILPLYSAQALANKAERALGLP